MYVIFCCFVLQLSIIISYLSLHRFLTKFFLYITRQLANEGHFPQELNALLNRKFAFKISISPFNIKHKSDGYSVSKLTDNRTVIAELDKIFDVIQVVENLCTGVLLYFI